jgi:hypothetical protein
MYKLQYPHCWERECEITEPNGQAPDVEPASKQGLRSIAVIEHHNMRPPGLRIEIYDEQVKIEIGVPIGATDVPKVPKGFDFLAGSEDSDSILVNLCHDLKSAAEQITLVSIENIPLRLKRYGPGEQ